MDEQAIEMAIDDVEAPIWPKPIGVVGIIWGTVNIGCMGCGAIGLMMPMFMGSSMQQAFPDGMPPTLMNPPLTIWLNYLVGLGLALLLIASGIVLLLRKPVARPMHLVYATIAVIATIFGLYAGWQMQAEINAWCQQHPDTAYAKQAAASGIFQWVGLGLGIVLGLGWPVFLLIWFGLVKRDSQEIARGVETLV